MSANPRTDDSERGEMLRWFERNRRHTNDLFASIVPEAYYDRPIELRNPIIFYEGHLSAFNFITLCKNALKQKPVDEEMERLFARGIDPDSPQADQHRWPSRQTVEQLIAEWDGRVRRALTHEPLRDPQNPLLHHAESVFTILEHEPMHHETFRYMLHRMPYEKKIARTEGVPRAASHAPQNSRIDIPSGLATLGANHGEVLFGWDNEFPIHRVNVPAFSIDRSKVTNAEFLEFIDARGYEERQFWSDDGWEWINRENVRHPKFWEREGGQWFWRGMHRRIQLPPGWPVYVSQAEAAAFARWKGGRLPSEAEYHRAAFGHPSGKEQSFPWGEEPPDATRGHFDFVSDDPTDVGTHPAGASAWGVDELIGNGWEWTSTEFGPFPGFRPMPSYPNYSNEFFDGKHYVVKGASPATALPLIRRSFRNWYRGTYPYIYGGFRTVSDSSRSLPRGLSLPD